MTIELTEPTDSIQNNCLHLIDDEKTFERQSTVKLDETPGTYLFFLGRGGEQPGFTKPCFCHAHATD